jgi:hypothetical protein
MLKKCQKNVSFEQAQSAGGGLNRPTYRVDTELFDSMEKHESIIDLNGGTKKAADRKESSGCSF